MRFKFYEPLPLIVGSTRTRIKFAWLPTIIKCYVVWLERYIVDEEVKHNYLFANKWVETNRCLY